RPLSTDAAAKTPLAERTLGAAHSRPPSGSSLRPVATSLAPAPTAVGRAPELRSPSTFGSRAESVAATPTPAPLSLAAGERRPLLQRVLSVLVLTSHGERKALAELLQSECIEPTFVDSARQASESA